MNATADLGDVCQLLAEVRDLLATTARPPAELLTRDDLAVLLAVGVSTLDRLRATGAVGPKPLELSGVKWSRAEVLAWLTHRDRTGELLDADTWPGSGKRPATANPLADPDTTRKRPEPTAPSERRRSARQRP